MNKRSNYVMIIGILVPFMHINVLQGVKILHLTLAVFILLSVQNFRTRIQMLPLLFSFYLILSYAIGYVQFGQFDQASTLTLSALVAILLAIFFPIMNNDIDRSKFIRGYVFGFAINSSINVYIYYGSSGAVSRISSWWSVGYSDVGQDLIAGQASFNEIGALTAIAAIFQLIAIFEKSSNSVLSRIRDIITLLLLLAGLILTGSRSATFAFLILAFHLYYLTLRTGHFKIPIFVWSIIPLFYYGGDIVVNRIMSLVTQPESGDAISGLSRLIAWDDAFNIFTNAPIFGTGYGYYPLASPSGLITAESYYFSLLAETGLIGLFLFLLNVYYGVKQNVFTPKLCSCCSSIHRKLEITYGIIIILIANVTGTILFDFVFSWIFYNFITISGSQSFHRNSRAVTIQSISVSSTK